jgi:hypothetical protein
MRGKERISGKKQRQKQARLRKMRKFRYAETVFKLFRRAEQPGKQFLLNRNVPNGNVWTLNRKDVL